MPIDADAVGDALRASDAAVDAPGKTHHLLCRREIGAFTQALEGTEDVIVACTQEKALFAEVAAQHEGVTAPIHFVNVRETGGWSAGAKRDARGFRAKTAALLAVAGLPAPDPVPVVDYRSDGNVLQRSEYRASYEESFVRELIGFWKSVVEGAPIRNTIEAATKDLALVERLTASAIR